MKRISGFIIIVLFLSCSDPGAVKSDPPDSVRMIYKTEKFDTLALEKGIDALVNQGENLNKIQVQWYKHSEHSKLASYNIYRSEYESGLVNYYKIHTKEIDILSSADTVYADAQDIEVGKRYYYYVTATNKDGIESEPSDTVSYKLMEKPVFLSLNGNAEEVSEPEFNFSWYDEFTDNFYIRIEYYISDDFHPLILVDKVASIYSDDNGYQHYHLEGDWLKTKFANGNYRWRIDCLGTENDISAQAFSGSESDWSSFLINWSN